MSAKTAFRIAVLPGDGIGVDVTREAVKALRAAERASGRFRLEMTEYECGASAYLRTGEDLPAATVAAARGPPLMRIGRGRLSVTSASPGQ
jgi:3-isopropylmalate dehydrogenase